MATLDQQTLVIRPLEPGDLDELFGSHSRHYADEWLLRQRTGAALIAVAVLDGRPVGRCGLDFRRDAYGYIWAAHVEADYQSQGVGSALLAHLEQVARERGLKRLRLGVGKANPRAQALYERLGYTVVGEDVARWLERRDGQLVEVHEDCWAMEKPLG